MMTKLLLEIELHYDAVRMHGDDPKGQRWFFEQILGNADKLHNALVLHSNELGTDIGVVIVKSKPVLP